MVRATSPLEYKYEITIDNLQICLQGLSDYSPEGPVNVVPGFTGVANFGEPSELKLNFCAEA